MLNQDPSFYLFILRSWARADIGLPDMLNMTGIPPNLYREQFRILNREEDTEAALTCLAAWETAMQAPSWPERMSDQAIASLENGLNKSLARGWARWLVRTAQWQEYAERAEARTTQRNIKTQATLATYEDGSLMHKLALKKLLEGNEATDANKVELYRLLSASDAARPSTESIASLLLSPELEPPLINAFRRLFDSESSDISPLIRELWEVYLRMEAGDFLEGQQRLTALLTGHHLSLRIVHRVYWLLGLCELELGHKEASLVAFTEANTKASTDPLILQTMAQAFGPDHLLPNGQTVEESLALLTPQNPVHVSFQTGDILLTGIDIEPTSSDPTPSTILSVYFRFFDHVPPDLSMNVRCIKGHNYVAFRQRIEFKEIAPVEFGAGVPQVGSVLVVQTELPSFVYGNTLLRIGLYSLGAKARIRTDGELPYLEIESWEHVLRHHPTSSGR